MLCREIIIFVSRSMRNTQRHWMAERRIVSDAIVHLNHCTIRVNNSVRRGQLKCGSTSAEIRFRLSAKQTSPFKSAGASVQSTTGSRGVRISGSNAGYTMFRGSVKSTGYSLHSLVSPSPPLPCVTVCHHITTGVYPTQPCQHSNRLRYHL